MTFEPRKRERTETGQKPAGRSVVAPGSFGPPVGGEQPDLASRRRKRQPGGSAAVPAFVLFVLAVLTALPSEAEVRVVARANVTAQGKFVEIGEVAEVTGAPASLVEAIRQHRLGSTPPPGQTLYVPARALEIHLAGLVPDDHKLNLVAPDAVSVTGCYRVLSGEEIEIAIREHVLHLHPEYNERFQVSFNRRLQPVSLPAHSDVALKVSTPDPDCLGPTLFQVGIEVGGRHFRTIAVVGRVGVMQDVVVAAHDIPTNTLLSIEDLRVEQKAVKPGAHVSRDPLEFLDLRTRRSLSQGDVVELSALKREALFKRGTILTVAVRAGNVIATARARALQDGFRGKLVQVENVDTHKRLGATAVSADRVEIVLH